MKSYFFILIIAGGLIFSGIALFSQAMPFGGEKDVTFANQFWTAMKGYQEWPMKSEFYPGQSPHGKVLKLYYNLVNVDGEPYHVIVKDNFGGENATVETVAKSPKDYLAAVTIMVQMDEGYDPDNNNWFYAKYLKDGSLDKNAQGTALAGRVAKGMNAGCIACHKKAGDNDYLFSND
ncbi:hypothetical protein GF406_06535 [candidate division KSB1 bacterium]|nr:hypothetical protein [candidate division KSB1 bacterium]